MIWAWLTESCPDRYWGASLSMLGLMGDVTEMDGRSIFWDSKELEPVGTKTSFSDTPASNQEGAICRHSLDSSCACVLSGILGISLERRRRKKKKWDNRKRKEVVGRDQIDLMLTVECFNSCINLHLANSSLSCTKQLTYRNRQRKGYCWFFLPTLKHFQNNWRRGWFCCAVLSTPLATERTRNKREPLSLLILFWEQPFQVKWLIWSMVTWGQEWVGLDGPRSSELTDRSQTFKPRFDGRV